MCACAVISPRFASIVASTIMDINDTLSKQRISTIFILSYFSYNTKLSIMCFAPIPVIACLMTYHYQIIILGLIGCGYANIEKNDIY